MEIKATHITWVIWAVSSEVPDVTRNFFSLSLCVFLIQTWCQHDSHDWCDIRSSQQPKGIVPSKNYIWSLYHLPPDVRHLLTPYNISVHVVWNYLQISQYSLYILVSSKATKIFLRFSKCFTSINPNGAYSYAHWYHRYSSL